MTAGEFIDVYQS